MPVVKLTEILQAVASTPADVIRWADCYDDDLVHLVLYSTLQRRAYGSLWCTSETFLELKALDGDKVVLLRV